MEIVIGIVLLVLSFFGVKSFLKNKSDQASHDAYVKKDTDLDSQANEVDARLADIKKEIAEAKSGRPLTPDEVEKYWEDNG